MAKNKKNKKLSKESILEEAKQLFSTKGYRATTLKDLTASFGVSRPSLYYYFQSKVDLLMELHAQRYNKGFVEFQEIMASSMPTKEKFRKILEAHARNMASEAEVNKILYIDANEMPDKLVKEIRQRRKQYIQQVIEIYKQGVEEGEFKDLDPKLAAYLIWGACNWITMWYSTKKSIKVDVVVETIVELLSHGYES